MQVSLTLANFIIPPAADEGVAITRDRVWSPVSSSFGFFKIGSKIRMSGFSRWWSR